jgi:hypothetical protein
MAFCQLARNGHFAPAMGQHQGAQDDRSTIRTLVISLAYEIPHLKMRYVCMFFDSEMQKVATLSEISCSFL